jgi:hypothetical protein
MGFATKIITNLDQVPDNFVRVCSLVDDKAAQKRLLSAANDGFIPAVKLMATTKSTMGPVFVDREYAVRKLRESESRSDEQRVLRLIDPPNANKSLDRLEPLLERIASSLDLIADAVTRVATASEAKNASQTADY